MSPVTLYNKCEQFLICHKVCVGPLVKVRWYVVESVVWRGPGLRDNRKWRIFYISEPEPVTRHHKIPVNNPRAKGKRNRYIWIYFSLEFYQKINFHYGHDKSCRWLMNKVWFESTPSLLLLRLMAGLNDWKLDRDFNLREGLYSLHTMGALGV